MSEGNQNQETKSKMPSETEVIPTAVRHRDAIEARLFLLEQGLASLDNSVNTLAATLNACKELIRLRDSNRERKERHRAHRAHEPAGVAAKYAGRIPDFCVNCGGGVTYLPGEVLLNTLDKTSTT